MQLRLADRNARLELIRTALGVGGSLPIYSGPPPGIANSPTGTLLATLTSASLTAASDGASTLTATADSSGDASGTPGYWRLLTSGGTAIAEGTAGIGSGELSFNTGISLGGNVSLTSGTLTEGNA